MAEDLFLQLWIRDDREGWKSEYWKLLDGD
jgi:hypothetical protein